MSRLFDSSQLVCDGCGAFAADTGATVAIIPPVEQDDDPDLAERSRGWMGPIPF